MAKAKEPKIIRLDDIDPGHTWDRPIQAPGHMQVDFEERINFRRLHDYHRKECLLYYSFTLKAEEV